jgi:alpha-tubulin suppressor-like RCC1 family protein
MNQSYKPLIPMSMNGETNMELNQSWLRFLPTAIVMLLLLVGSAVAAPNPNEGARGGGRTGTGAAAMGIVNVGEKHACAIRDDGTLVCWGDNSLGQLNSPTGEFTQVSSGPLHSCAIRADGFVLCWGDNFSGETNAPLARFIQVSVGGAYSCGIRDDGQAVCWGDAAYGPLAAPAGEFMQISAGANHACALTGGGMPVCWGDNYAGQATPPQTQSFIHLSSGLWQTCGIRTDGTVACWGQTVGDPPAGRFTQISAGDGHACGVKDDGTAACWGNVAGPVPSGTFLEVSAGKYHDCGLKTDGTTVCWGDDVFGGLNAPAGFFGHRALSVGRDDGCQIKTDGTVACWNNWGGGTATTPIGTFTQLSAGKFGQICGIRSEDSLECWSTSGDPFLSPAPMGSFSQVSVGHWHACAVRTEGTVICWGQNYGGQVDAPLESGFTQIAAGEYHSCGLKADGSITCWGDNSWGQLDIPPGIFTQVSAGQFHTCALRTDGTLACWGNDFQSSTVPAGRFTQVTAGSGHNCALRSDGTAACWGDNSYGQATPPPGTFIQLSVEGEQSCGVRSNGSRECWGMGPHLTIMPDVLSEPIVGVEVWDFLWLQNDGNGGYTPAPPEMFSLADDSTLPPGLTLAQNGTLSGTPTTAGTFTFTIRGEDGNGFTAVRTFTMTVREDTTAPVIAPALTGTLGSNGWYTGTVNLVWQVTDDESQITSQTGCDAVAYATDIAGVTTTCTATSSGGTASQSVTIRRDATAPQLSLPAPMVAEATSSSGAVVVFNPSASDATSGVQAVSCTPASGSTFALGTTTVQCTAIDNAGNSATGAFEITVRDTTPPALVCPADINGTVGQSVALGTPIMSDTVDPTPVLGNNAPGVFPPGVTTVQWTAMDVAGNTSACVQNVTLIYTFNGFLQPVDNLPVLNQTRYRSGKGIPVQFSLGENHGLDIFAAGYPVSQAIACPADAPIDDIEQLVSATASGLGYNTVTGTYTYTWAMQKTWAGTCRQLVMKLKDGAEYRANFKFN